MSDLISKHEIISEFENDLLCLKFGSALKGTFRDSIDISDVIERIEEFPEVDAVEVVRCKECERWDAFADGLDGAGYCYKWHDNVQSDGYCYYGEREEVGE